MEMHFGVHPFRVLVMASFVARTQFVDSQFAGIWFQGDSTIPKIPVPKRGGLRNRGRKGVSVMKDKVGLITVGVSVTLSQCCIGNAGVPLVRTVTHHLQIAE